MTTAQAANHIVRQFREVLLWPVELMPLESGNVQNHWELLQQCGGATPWRRLAHRFESETLEFAERHCKEFVMDDLRWDMIAAAWTKT